ncbi:MAG: hypothetical protein MZU97_18865 [Bacillus subtilis]|nr:hypothetical protein [Bacillus subtilis]
MALSPFAVKKLGLVSNQTLLKVDTYSLVCVPYRLSMKGAVLLGSFSRDEIVFFQAFQGFPRRAEPGHPARRRARSPEDFLPLFSEPVRPHEGTRIRRPHIRGFPALPAGPGNPDRHLHDAYGPPPGGSPRILRVSRSL